VFVLQEIINSNPELATMKDMQTREQQIWAVNGEAMEVEWMNWWWLNGWMDEQQKITTTYNNNSWPRVFHSRVLLFVHPLFFFDDFFVCLFP
jgi:hypothetical protein